MCSNIPQISSFVSAWEEVKEHINIQPDIPFLLLVMEWFLKICLMVA